MSLHTHLVVREDAHVLFGFGTERERSLFRELIKVSGVGPRIALGILSGVSVDEFHRCVEAQDAASLTRIPGHRSQDGRAADHRNARSPEDAARARRSKSKARSAGTAALRASPQAEAFSALVALGYKPAEVTRLLQKVDAVGDDDRRPDPPGAARRGQS